MGCRRVHIFPTSSLASRRPRACPLQCPWCLVLLPCKLGDGINNSPFAVYEIKSYTKHARGRGYGQLKKKKKKAETSTWVSSFGCVPLQWHRNEVTATNTCIEELGYVMWIMLCVKFALGHIFPLPFPRRQVGIPITRAVRWDTGMIRRAPHLQEKMTFLNFKNVLGLTEKAQNK